ncbi:recombination regulator RecX [Tepidimonas sp.]|uniref:recombination regulator RecX n=1 Tax=Tepidimonas sp. TaxID=2002775 RepID=UPI002FE27F71
MPPAAPTLKARALRLLARRDYTRHELAQRLAPHAADEAELEAVLDECARRGWLDEARALEAHLHRRAGERGRALLQAELRARGFDDEVLLEQAAARLRATEAERAQAAWKRRFGTAPRDAAERARQLRFLLARGFAPEVARRTVPRSAAEGDGAAGESPPD